MRYDVHEPLRYSGTLRKQLCIACHCAITVDTITEMELPARGHSPGLFHHHYSLERRVSSIA
jgi:hypothetical protein